MDYIWVIHYYFFSQEGLYSHPLEMFTELFGMKLTAKDLQEL